MHKITAFQRFFSFVYQKAALLYILQPQALLGLHRFDEAMHEAAFLTRDTPGDASVLELTRSAIEQARRTSE